MTIRMTRRGTRSASTPAKGVITSDGPRPARAAKPSHAEESVRSKTTFGTATVCIQLPEFEISAAHQNRAKSRCLKAPMELRSVDSTATSSAVTSADVTRAASSSPVSMDVTCCRPPDVVPTPWPHPAGPCQRLPT